jgi:HAD superfamily hydrolase (TIGR01490 family)
VGLVFVDVDGTLLRGPSSEALFIAHLLARGELGRHQMMQAAVFLGRWSGRFRRHTVKKNKAYLAGLEVERIGALAERFVHRELAPRIRPPMRERLDRHRRDGHTLVLLTGTLDCIAAPLARLVDADLWCATLCTRDNGHYSAEPPVSHPFGTAKLDLALELCAASGADLEACWAYADAAHDLPLLRRVGRPVAVSPDWILYLEARRAGWEVMAGSRSS